ncbi:MAG: hypothetical protein JWN33_255 [Candidatus Saccharibacteria bacterium]|nr:hypothetical protein [Candidatus Saccharibacteria bacterium]
MVVKTNIPADKLKTALVITVGRLIKQSKGPDELLGDLFTEVQKRRVYGDGKTFADLVPIGRIKTIQDDYKLERHDPEFDIREFVSRHFYDLSTTIHNKAPFHADHRRSTGSHITHLWEHLERRNRLNRGSLIALPHKYIVPGGRFNEQFYWDSYFIMLGLAADKRWHAIESMMKNYAFMIGKFGFIPTANRTYFLSRSQPPFFSYMIELLATHRGRRTYIEYLPSLLEEYRFWMRGKTKLKQTEHNAYRRVVQMEDGTLLNRYYDNKATPRPESLDEDTAAADESAERQADRMYLHLRAAAESGWDFSSRWFADQTDIKTIHTADIIPVDLNCLLYHQELLLARMHRRLLRPLTARRFKKKAERRKAAILKYCWDDKEKFFTDYNFHHQSSTKRMTLAAVFPLYEGIATDEQAAHVAKRLKKDFLKKGGLVTTLINNGQQWDGPNGWAPLQWVAIQGLRRYGYHELANDIKARWLQLNDGVYDKHYKLIEKYDVTSSSGLGGGGEYPLQDGFGWTNGVYKALQYEESLELRK